MFRLTLPRGPLTHQRRTPTTYPTKTTRHQRHQRRLEPLKVREHPPPVNDNQLRGQPGAAGEKPPPRQEHDRRTKGSPLYGGLIQWVGLL